MPDNIKIGRITNANIYDGGSNLIGRAEEIKPPEVMALLTEHKGLGLVGKFELPSGFDKMECSIKWNTLDPDVVKMHSNIFQARQFMVRAEIAWFGSAGLIDQMPLVLFITATPKKTPGIGTFKQHEQADVESNYTVTAYKQIIDGETLVEIDLLANIYIVDGVDLLAVTRANLGA
jgi:hypothetical protein